MTREEKYDLHVKMLSKSFHREKDDLTSILLGDAVSIACDYIEQEIEHNISIVMSHNAYLEQQLANLKHNYEAQEIMIADYKKRIEELELRLSLSDSALDEYKQQVASLEAPRSCQLCKYWTDSTLQVCTWHNIDTTNIYHYCNGCDEYEPKDKQ